MSEFRNTIRRSLLEHRITHKDCSLRSWYLLRRHNIATTATQKCCIISHIENRLSIFSIYKSYLHEFVNTWMQIFQHYYLGSKGRQWRFEYWTRYWIEANNNFMLMIWRRLVIIMVCHTNDLYRQYSHFFSVYCGSEGSWVEVGCLYLMTDVVI